MSEKVNESIAELQAQLCYQDEQLDVLNKMLFEQQNQLHELTRLVQQMHRRQTQQKDEGEVINTPPPHY